MKSPLFKKLAVEVICLLYILLFIYAAVSKLLDFHDFLIQIGKSPILTAYAEVAAVGVIATEILIVLLLLFPKYRFLGLFLSLSLMTMFSAYITILLLWSPYVPCSCGGILSTLGWHEHLVFNLVFVLLAVWGVLWIEKTYSYNSDGNTFGRKRFKFLIWSIIGNILLSIVVIGVLYVLSEDHVHRNNGFVRRYPHHPVTMLKSIPIKYNSYYIAGFDKGRIYLGNLTVPSHVFSTDTTLTHTANYTIELKNAEHIAFTAPRLSILSHKFYIADGSASVLYGGNLIDWTGDKIWQGSERFLQFKPTSPDTFIVSALHNNSIALGLVSGRSPIQYFPKLLPETTGGIFSNDGLLLYNAEEEKLLYVYYYKNSYLTASKSLGQATPVKTIDTLKISKIKIAKEDNGIKQTIANHAEMLQVQAATSDRYLFIKSKRLGKYEETQMLKEASIIDVYNVSGQTYEFSFYLYHYENEEIKSFEIYGNLLVGLSDHYLVLYRLQPYYFKK